MGNFGNLTDKELMESSEVENFFVATRGYENSINELLASFISKGMTDEQFFNVVMNSSRENTERFSKNLKRNGIEYPKGVSLSKYSTSESKEKEKLSLEALKAYATGKLINVRKEDFLYEGLEKKTYTEQEVSALHKTRDTMHILLNPGNEPEVISGNKKMADYMLCKDVDRTKYTDAEFVDLKQKRFAELYNKKLQEMLQTDYSKFASLDDEQLVKNWVEYAKTYEALHLIREENAVYTTRGRSKNDYIDKELVRKVNEIEDKYGSLFLRDSSRIRTIANPYYSKYDVKGFDNITQDQFFSLTGDLGNGPLSNWMRDLSAKNSGTYNVFMENLVYEVNKTADGVRTNDISIFDSKGNPIDGDENIFRAATNAPIFVAPKDRPDLLTPYVYDEKSMNPNAVDPKPYAKVMEKIKSSMPDATQQWKENEELLKGGRFDKFRDTNQAYRDDVYFMALDVQRSKDPEKYKTALVSEIKRVVTPRHPKMDYDEYAKMIGLKESEKFSKETIEERRQLSERAAIGLLDHNLRNSNFSDEVGKLIKGTSVRQFSAFMLKQTNSREENEATIREFFGGDANKKKEMILQRVSEYKTSVDNLYGRSFSDKELIDNMHEILTTGTGMGMEFVTPILGNIKNWGLEFTDKELTMMKDLNEKAYMLNNMLKPRINTIGTTYYQYGGMEKLSFGEKAFEKASTCKDPMYQKTFFSVMPDLIARGGSLCESILKHADPSNSKEVEFFCDGKGNTIAAGDVSEFGRKAFESGRAYIFYKGQKDPVVVDCKEPNAVPPAFENVEITPQMQTEFENMRFNYSLVAVDKNRNLSPEMKTLEKNLKYQSFELGAIADSLKASPKNSKPLKRKMAEYLATLTVRDIVANKADKMDKQTLKGIVSDESIKKLATDIRKSPIVDMVIDNILKKPDGFKNLNPDEVYDNMLNQTEKLNKLQQEQKKLQKSEPEKSVKID